MENFMEDFTSAKKIRKTKFEDNLIYFVRTFKTEQTFEIVTEYKSNEKNLRNLFHCLLKTSTKNAQFIIWWIILYNFRMYVSSNVKILIILTEKAYKHIKRQKSIKHQYAEAKWIYFFSNNFKSIWKLILIPFFLSVGMCMYVFPYKRLWIDIVRTYLASNNS